MSFQPEGQDFWITLDRGSGWEGRPYDATRGEGWTAGECPHWTRRPEWRKEVVVTCLERRLSCSNRKEYGTIDERLERVTRKLAERHARKVAENEAKFSWQWSLDDAEQEKEYKRFCTRRARLFYTENWPDKVFKMVEDRYPYESDDRIGWDMGQCAHRIGIADHTMVRQFFYALEHIGGELFPEVPPALTDDWGVE
jgi:hypothetical protein